MKKKGIGFYFKRIDEIMSMAANAHLKKYDITCSQANILFYMLEKGKNVVMQKEIEQEFWVKTFHDLSELFKSRMGEE